MMLTPGLVDIQPCMIEKKGSESARLPRSIARPMVNIEWETLIRAGDNYPAATLGYPD